MGEDVTSVVKDFFDKTSPIASTNQTFIALIPKLKTPESMSDFRPISLCNAFYKIISKTMANRMKDAFFEIISPH